MLHEKKSLVGFTFMEILKCEQLTQLPRCVFVPLLLFAI